MLQERPILKGVAPVLKPTSPCMGSYCFLQPGHRPSASRILLWQKRQSRNPHVHGRKLESVRSRSSQQIGHEEGWEMVLFHAQGIALWQCRSEFIGKVHCFERFGRDWGRKASSGLHAREFIWEIGTTPPLSVFSKSTPELLFGNSVSAEPILASGLTGGSEIGFCWLSLIPKASATASQSSRHPSSSSSSLRLLEQQSLLVLLLLLGWSFLEALLSKLLPTGLFNRDSKSLSWMLELSFSSSLDLISEVSTGLFCIWGICMHDGGDPPLPLESTSHPLFLTVLQSQINYQETVFNILQLLYKFYKASLFQFLP